VFYQWPNLASGHRLESYLFDYELDSANDPTLAADLVSVGSRGYRAPTAGQWNYEVEAVLQRGHSGASVAGIARPDLHHRASLLHLELGFMFDKPWAFNLMLQYDRATGDEDPTDQHVERFNTLFGSRRFEYGPTGIYGTMARGNLSSPGVRVTFRPRPRWQAMFSYRSLKLVAARDAWVGAGWRDDSGAAGRSIGNQLEGSFTWTAIPERLTVETGFANLWSGRFAKQTAGTAFRGDPRYFYAMLTTTF
jgi:hypothetical protein